MVAESVREVFQHVHMEGARFTDGALPLSATEELHRYERLVENVARSLFLADNPRRRRVGAAALGVEGFDFAITRLSKGSVGVDLSVRRAPTVSVGDDYVERARKLIEEAFADLAADGQLPPGFPPELVPEIAAMGTSLNEGERFTWARSKRVLRRSRAVLTPTTTEPIRQYMVPELELEPVEDLFNAWVVGVCSDPLEFSFKVEGSDRTQKGRYRDQRTFHILREVCGFANRTPLVALTVMRKSPNGAVLDVVGAETLLPPSWAARLEEMSRLEAGWLDGVGLPVSPEALKVAESFLFKVLDAQLSRPGVFPTRDGGIQMEWAHGSSDVEVFVSGGGSIRVYYDDEDDDGFVGTADLVLGRVREVLGDSTIP